MLQMLELLGKGQVMWPWRTKRATCSGMQWKQWTKMGWLTIQFLSYASADLVSLSLASR